MDGCPVCGRAGALVSEGIGACVECLRAGIPDALMRAQAAHGAARAAFGLPVEPPRTEGGLHCALCANECRMGEGERGFCGLRTVQGGKVTPLAGTAGRGLLHWYRDPLPTNCVADWVCAGSRQRGDHNLAVFYSSCTMDCLFCQNWHYRRALPARSETMDAEELAARANARTFCVCFFGGDPASQMAHAVAAARRLTRRGVRICWEANGMMHPRLLDAALQLSLDSGGCIKFDVKAFDERVHVALTGVSNRRTLENVARAAARYGERPEPPPVVVSTLLVPGYVDGAEVRQIARFLASCDRRIPWALLAFAPQFAMSDLPCTPLGQAQEAEAAAREAGLTRVRVGNRHLLGWA